MKTLTKLFLLLLVATASAQPPITGSNPTISCTNCPLAGGGQFHIGNAEATYAAGVPGTIAGSATGDFYVDTTAHQAYICQSAPGPCTAVAGNNWQPIASGLNDYVVSVTTFGVGGNSSTDATNFQTALNATAGLACLFIPSGTNILMAANSVNLPPFSCIKGNGLASGIYGVSLATAGVGMLNVVNGSNGITLSNFFMDGNVTTPVGVNYSTAVTNGPMYSGFTTGSSIWFHGNNNKINISDLTISHTGGYAVLFDARSGPNTDIRMTRFTDINARPNLFGTSSLIYGSWTGGVLFMASGTINGNGNYNVTVEDSTWQNVTGNCLWMAYTPGSTINNSANFRFTNNTFIDVGLDAILVSGLNGYVETGNRVQRGGYVVTSDIGASRVGGPLWLQGFSPVAFDNYSSVTNFIRSNNYALECGGMFSLDGAAIGTVSGNTLESPFASPDPLAASGSCGPSIAVGQNYVGGVVIANSSGVGPTPQNINVTGNTFNGVGYGGILAYPCLQCNFSDNLIYQTANNANPIVLANTSTSSLGHTTGTLVTNNLIYWTASSPAIVENCQPLAGACQFPFFSSDLNTVFRNKVIGGAFEFQRNPTGATGGNADASGSGNLTLNSVTPGNSLGVNGIVMQVEGTLSPFLNMYLNNGSGTVLYTVSPSGSQFQQVAFSSLPAVPGKGYMVYCTNCNVNTSPCTTGGPGALAVTDATQWNCLH